MNNLLSSLLHDIEAHTDQIWVNEPSDILRIKTGIIESGAGIRDQYFTVMVMLSGEVRALGIHIFSDLREFAAGGEFTLPQLVIMTRKMLHVDLGVISYFGLKSFGTLLERFERSLDDIATVEEYSQLCEKMFILANRYQLWMHQIFPWHLMTLFPKTTIEKEKQRLSELVDRL